MIFNYSSSIYSNANLGCDITKIGTQNLYEIRGIYVLKKIATMSSCFTNAASFLQQIGPTAKKLWGVDEGKGDSKGLFNIGEQTWRDAAWSTGHPAGKEGSLVFRNLAYSFMQDKPRKAHSGPLGWLGWVKEWPNI